MRVRVAPRPTLEPVTLARAALSAGIVLVGKAGPTPPRRPRVRSRAHVSRVPSLSRVACWGVVALVLVLCLCLCWVLVLGAAWAWHGVSVCSVSLALASSC